MAILNSGLLWARSMSCPSPTCLHKVLMSYTGIPVGPGHVWESGGMQA